MLKRTNRILSPLVCAVGMWLCLLSQPLVAETLKIATVAPEGSSWMRDMRAGAKEIEARTEGRVQLKFYGGGVMGNDKSMLRKMRIGQLQGGAFVAGSLAPVYPSMNIYSLPLLFRSLEEVRYVREKLDPVLIDGLRKERLVSFGFAEGGFAQVMSNVPVRSLGDLKGMKVWVPEGDVVGYAVMQQLGLAPVTLPITDVLTGLQTGLVDIVATSPIGALVFQWHTKVKYVMSTPLVYLFGTLVLDERAFARLEKRDQAVVAEVMERIYAEFDARNAAENESAAEALVANGLQYLEPLTEDEIALRSRAGNLVEDLAQKDMFDPALYARVKQHLGEYRSGSQPAQAQSRP